MCGGKTQAPINMPSEDFGIKKWCFFFIKKQYISANKLRTFRLFNNLYINLKCLTLMLVILKLGWKSINACINLVLNSYINKFSYFVLVFFVRDQRVGTVLAMVFPMLKGSCPLSFQSG